MFPICKHAYYVHNDIDLMLSYGTIVHACFPVSNQSQNIGLQNVSMQKTCWIQATECFQITLDLHLISSIARM